ncbi:YcaO-like family protein [Devosia sp. XK-2]|uniref:YcaO-like family protein n=1 Tax=Devosia sp. XK-2 TaxID=3126689 RepID=UPI0030D4622D
MAHVTPHLDLFGITRVADQTRLDRIGISCFAAMRPNAMTLAVNQGKGPDDATARLSAIMEAVEFAVAECPTATTSRASAQHLAGRGERFFMPERLLPEAGTIAPHEELTWLTGYNLHSGETALVPLDSVTIGTDYGTARFSQSTNGLAAGLAMDDCIIHALCELVERDAYSLWSLMPLNRCAATRISPGAAVGATARATIEAIANAGLNLDLFNLTSDIGLPVVMALIWDDNPRTYFDVASGICARADSDAAIAGAIEEAAQTRVTNISGARDDIDPSDYDKALPQWIAKLIAMDRRKPDAVLSSLDEQAFRAIIDRIGDDLTIVPLTRENELVQVVKVLSNTLEDRTTNRHWRPGRRALRSMTAI